jgi:hypothetical protein
MSGMSWTQLRWRRNLEIAQIVSEQRFEEIKEKLRFYSDRDSQTDACCNTLDQLERTIRSASWHNAWKEDPVALTQTAIDQILALERAELDPELMILELMKIDLETLTEHPPS